MTKIRGLKSVRTQIRGGVGRVLTSRALSRGTLWAVALLLSSVAARPVAAWQASGEVIEMTLERMVQMALSSSYRVRQLDLSIERTQLNLRSQRARLRSSVNLEVSAPDYRSISQNRWNSTLQREEIVHEDSRRLEAELSIRQPVILFGYPTNGYLSLNNRIYRYTQFEDDGGSDLRYYNRAFVRYTQPLFQPNELRNDIEGAELDLEDAELGFYEDVLEIVDDVSDDYFGLFEEAYSEIINLAHVANLEAAELVAQEAAQVEPSRGIELRQIRVELANAREQLQQSRSQFRLEASRLKTRLNIPDQDEITLNPVMELQPVPIDVERATQFALELTPRMRQLDINYRESEIRLEQTKGRGGVQVDLAISYGREMQDPRFAEMWGQPTNTYTVGVNGRIPIWDWGARKYRIEASRISLRQTDMRIEEAEAQIRANVQNEVRNVAEYQSRALAMEENLALASGLSQESLDGYRRGDITAVELLQGFRRETDTAQNFLDSYMGLKGAITRLQQLTYFDFERGLPVLERFGVELPQSP